MSKLIKSFGNFISFETEEELLRKERREKLLNVMSDEERCFIELDKIPLDIIEKYLNR